MARAGNAVNGSITAIQSKSERSLGGPGVYGMQHLGYDVYFLTILGVWRILSCSIAHSEIPFVTGLGLCGLCLCHDGGGIFSHRSERSREGAFSLLLLVTVTVASRYFRPAD